MHVWTYTYELSWYCTPGEIRVPHWNTPMALDCKKDKWKTKKEPSWEPNTEKRWKVLEKKSSGLLAYSNRPWDLNLKKQKFTAQPEPMLVNPQNLRAKEVSHQAMYFQFAQLAYPIRMSSTIDLTIKESQKNKMVKEDGLGCPRTKADGIRGI